MTIETDLQAVISATTTLNSTVQNLTNSVWAATNAAVADSQSRTTTAINNLNSSVQAELNILRPFATDYQTWNVLTTPVRIYGASVIGNGWADGSGASQTVTYNGTQYTISDQANGNGKNAATWSNEVGAYVPNPGRNGHYQWGAADSYGSASGNATERLVGSNAHGSAIGSAYAPVLRKKSDYSLLTFTNAQNQTDYYRCYWDINLDGIPAKYSYRADQPFVTLNSGMQLYLVMTGSVIGHPDRTAITWMSTATNHIGSYNGAWGYSVFDTDGNGSVDVVTSNFARPHIYRGDVNGSPDAGVPETGDAAYTAGVTMVVGQTYGGPGHQNYSNGYNAQYELDPTFVPVPNTSNSSSNNYQASWAIPLGGGIIGSASYLRVYNWGYTAVVIEGWGFAYGPKRQV